MRKDHCNCKVYQPIDYKLSNDTVFNPDLLIVCKPITKTFLDFPPGLVVEILSESTSMKDRNVKYPKYEEEGIPYYLMVDTDIKTIEVYSLTSSLYQRQPLDQSKHFEFTIGDRHFEMVFDRIWE